SCAMTALSSLLPQAPVAVVCVSNVPPYLTLEMKSTPSPTSFMRILCASGRPVCPAAIGWMSGSKTTDLPQNFQYPSPGPSFQYRLIALPHALATESSPPTRSIGTLMTILLGPEVSTWLLAAAGSAATSPTATI